MSYLRGHNPQSMLFLKFKKIGNNLIQIYIENLLSMGRVRVNQIEMEKLIEVNLI